MVDVSTLNKVQLRDALRAANVPYAGLNNEGMREKLAAHYASQAAAVEAVEAPVLEVQATDVVPAELRDAPAPIEAAVVVLPPVEPTAAPVRKIEANREKRNGQTRPSNGTLCAQIWAELDARREAGGGVLDVKAYKTWASESGINDHTRNTQLQCWRRFNGLVKGQL